MSRRPGARSPKSREKQRESSGRADTATPRPSGGRYSLALGTRLGHEGEADRVALRILGTSPSAAAGLPPPTGPSRPAPGGHLPEAARQPAEELLGFDFSGVRVDTAGGEATREGAHAVTRGDTVQFAPGRFRPDHPLGRALIAHELTHVAQQRAVPRRRTGGGAVPGGAGANLLGTPQRHREGIAHFRSERDSAALEASHAALADPRIATTPAPRGLRQRCDGEPVQAPPKRKGGPQKGTPEEGEAPGSAKADAKEAAPAVPPKSMPSEFTTYYADIDGAVKALNERLNPDTDLDPDWLRAMMAVETEEGTDPRQYDPLQVANKGDPAFPTLSGKTAGMSKKKKDLTLAEHKKTQLIDPDIAGELKEKAPTPWTKDESKRGGYWDYSKVAEDKRMDPQTSIAASAAWLFHKAAKYGQESVDKDRDAPPEKYTVKPGDSFAKIAIKKNTTMESLAEHNDKLKKENGEWIAEPLHPEEKILFKEASMKWEITGWRSWKDAIIAYNSRASYYDKVKKKYDQIKKAKKAGEEEGD